MSPTKKMAPPTERRVSPRKKIASPIKKDGRSLSFNWDKTSTMVLPELCAEFRSTHGKKQQFKWPQILEQFKDRTKQDINVVALRNRMEVLKKQYHIWMRLKGSESGLGIDPVTGKIDATDDWWDMKIKEHSDFRKFRDKGVPPDMEALWDKVFGDSYATGEYCVAPGMEEPPVSPTPNIFDVEQHSTPADLNTPVREKDLDLEGLDCIDPLIFRNFPLNEGERGNLSNAPSSAAPKRMSNASSGAPLSSPSGMTVGGSKRPSLSRAASVFQDAVAKLRDEGRRAYDLIGNIFAPPSTMPSDVDPDKHLKDAYDVLYQMVEDGLLVTGKDLFCFAASKILDENGRKGFMFLKSNSDRLAWLEYQMKNNISL